MDKSGCLITVLAMIVDSEGRKIALTDKNGLEIKVEPNPLNVFKKLYTSPNTFIKEKFEVIIPEACKLLGL